MSGETFDVIIVGAGPAGEVMAGRLAQRRRRVALVESRLVGGECAYYACMPSKALLRPADALAEARRIPGVAHAISGELDVSAVLARRDEVIHGLDDSEQLSWLQDRGITLLRGHGRLDGTRRVRVREECYEAREAVVLAVGSKAARPPMQGLEEADPWTNEQATTAKEIPRRLIVLGGGVVGVELAQAYSTLGSEVTIVEAASRLLIQEEPFAAEEILRALRERGIDVHMGVRAEAVRRVGENVVVELGDRSRVEGDQILVAVGRRPATDDLGLETVGLEPGAKIPVDDQLRVPERPWLYAIGDVNGRSLLTHSGKYQAHVASDVIDGGRSRASRDGADAPRVVFTDPQLAAVGLTLEAAKQAGLDVHAYDASTSSTAGASFYGRDTPGTSRLVVDEGRGVIVGATFTGTDVAEWLQAATIAIVGEVRVDRLWEAPPPFPTRSEIWLKLLEKREAELRGANGG